jgi:phage-related protein
MSAGEPPPEARADKPLVLLHGGIKTLPLSAEARKEVGYLLRRLQRGEPVGMPHSRPMPPVGPRCHELRVNDANGTWRVFYRIDDDAVLVAGVEAKKTQKAPKAVIDKVAARLAGYDRDIREAEEAERRKRKAK